MKNHYLNMLAYNHWANGCFLGCLSNNTVANAKVYLLMSHILTAEEIWLCRLQEQAAPNERLWQEYPLPILKEKSRENKTGWEAWLRRLQEDDLSAMVSYHNTKGEAFSTAISDVLNHIVNHGTYHRGQIAGLLRLESVDPPASDYIVYAREK